MKLTDIDPNFKSVTVGGSAFELIDAKKLSLEGFPWECENEKSYYRIPERIEGEVTEAIQVLSTQSAGGVLRFLTDSRALFLKVRFRPISIMPHMPLSGEAGFDLSVRENGADRLLANFYPDPSVIIDGGVDFEYSYPLEPGMQEYRIHFPLYAGVEEVQVGFTEGAKVEKAPAHKVPRPILFYGSSITQGGCASRPSSCHAALLSSWVDAEQINLGFSGNAKGEQIFAETIAELDLSCFVMDYDHNAPTSEHLAETHESFFKTIRSQHPDLPVIFISRPLGKIEQVDDAEKRKAIILKTYENARNNGDKNVYFVDGMKFYDGFSREVPTVDRTHPTDLGFYLMAKGILPSLKQAVGLS